MTNITRQPKLDVDPNHGRRAIDVFTKELGIRARSMSTSRPFVVFVFAAALVLGVYYFLLAAPLYVSEASFAIKGRSESGAAAASILTAIGGAVGGGGSSTPGSTDTAELQTYVQSYEMANKLDREFHLREAYAHPPRPDFLNWLPSDASQYDFLNFYRKMVHVSIDHDTSLISVEVRAFDPKMAQAMTAAILQHSSEYLNNLSAIIREDTIKTSEQDLKDAEASVRKARLDMTSYRAATGQLDPAGSAMATATGMAVMQQEVLEARAELAQLKSFNQPSSPVVKQAEARIAGLEEQIAGQRNMVGDTKSNGNITERLRTYEGLQIANDYADRNLVAAMTAYDSARSVADQRDRFVVPATPPNLPDVATEPHRLSSFLEAMLVLIAVYGIVALAIAGVRDHQGI
jgi:capsular polysaccharide transport system permease protein